MLNENTMLKQLITVIEYLNFHGPLVFRIPSESESDVKRKPISVQEVGMFQ